MGQIWSNFVDVCPNSDDVGPNWSGSGRSWLELGESCPRSGPLSPASSQSRPESLQFGPMSAEFGQPSTKFDLWPESTEFGPTSAKLGSILNISFPELTRFARNLINFPPCPTATCGVMPGMRILFRSAPNFGQVWVDIGRNRPCTGSATRTPSQNRHSLLRRVRPKVLAAHWRDCRRCAQHVSECQHRSNGAKGYERRLARSSTSCPRQRGRPCCGRTCRARSVIGTQAMPWRQFPSWWWALWRTGPPATRLYATPAQSAPRHDKPTAHCAEARERMH